MRVQFAAIRAKITLTALPTTIECKRLLQHSDGNHYAQAVVELDENPATGQGVGMRRSNQSEAGLMRGIFLSGLILAFGVGASSLARAQVLTAQYDNARTGANLNEKILTPRNVNVTQFGKLFAFKVDGDVYAQPLYMPDLEVPGKGKHNVLFVATENDSVYAFDADGGSTAPLWQVRLANSDEGVKPLPEQGVSCFFIPPLVGITPTPVIQRDNQSDESETHGLVTDLGMLWPKQTKPGVLACCTPRTGSYRNRTISSHLCYGVSNV